MYSGGRGLSVILTMGNEEAREGIERMIVEGKIDSDHHPVSMWIEGEKLGMEGSGKRVRREEEGEFG